MKDLINYLDRGIISLDQDLKVLRWNKWLELKTTIPESDIIGKKLSDLFPQIGNKLAYRQLERAVKQKNPLILSPLLHKFLLPITNPSLYKKQGIEQMIQLVNGLAVTENNNFCYYLVQIEDHTERFLKEIKLKKFYDDLASKNDELAKIHQELELKNKILENTSQYKTEFLANMSHEIRTPMNSILGVTELIIEDSENLNDSQKEMLNVISVSSSSLMELINDILDLAKISAQKLELEKVEFELEPVIIDMFKVIASRTFDKDIDLICNCPLLPNFIIVDITRIKQILTNLMGNSAKFTEEGAITLDVSIEQKILSLKVSDTGIGIAENNLDKVFNSFVQADGSTTRKFGGTGLGLSLCKELCEIMNGSIEVESVFGEGTSFTVKIPIELGQPTPEIVTNSLSSERIVYIDNDHNNLKSLKKMASELNISLSTYTPQDCLVALQEKTWDIILIDQLSIKNNILDILPKQTDAKIINIHRTLCNSFATNNLFHHHLARPFSHKHFISLLNAKTNTKIITSINEFDVTGGVKTKILIVEDNKSNQFLMKKVLQNKYDFDFANNGLEAVNAVKEHDYDIILMDILMPVMDGLQATEKIRTFNKEIPILALTANNLASDREKCINSGMNDFIVKPINRQFLIEKIEEFSNPLS